MSANTDYYWKRIQETEANPVAAYQSKYQSAIDKLEANPVGPYQSKWQNQLDAALNAITNRKAFSYDFNADPMYQMYKDQYTKLGNEAAANAAANVSALSGGFGNSYATTAAAQANQQYLTKLNEMIPELYNLAMNKYKMEGDELNNRYSVLGTAEDRDYGRYRDQLADWYDKLNYLNSAEDRYYGRYRDQVADYNDLLAYLQGAYGTQLSNDQWRAELDEKIREFDLEYALKKGRLGGGGGGGGTRIVYVNGQPVEVKANNDGLESTINSLATDAAKQFQFNDKTPRSEKIENFKSAVDDEASRISKELGVSKADVSDALTEEALRRSGYFK